jgi:predicted secreted hydrolase
MSFNCRAPFRSWVIKFDGFVLHTSEQAMDEGKSVSFRRRLIIDLQVTCVSPVWDARTAPGEGGKTGMDAQSWAKEHYEQLVIAQGEIVLDGEKTAISATGWRDHSRGPRGGNTREPWGGHVIAGCQFPSGRKFLFSRYWRPDGGINLTGGMVLDGDGKRYSAEIVAAPELHELVLRGETLPIHLRWETGELQTTMETKTSVWIPRERKHTVGRDCHGILNDMYVLNWGPVEWDGEASHAYLERSAHLNALPARIGYTG